MRLTLFLGIAGLGLLGLGAPGCSGQTDPVAAQVEASGTAYTVAPEATMSPEEAHKVEQEIQRKQEAADKKARRR